MSYQEHEHTGRPSEQRAHNGAVWTRTQGRSPGGCAPAQTSEPPVARAVTQERIKRELCVQHPSVRSQLLPSVFKTPGLPPT